MCKHGDNGNESNLNRSAAVTVFRRIQRGVTLALLTSTAVLSAGVPTSQMGDLAAPDLAARKSFFTRYCFGCHNDRVKTAGVSIQGVDFANPGPQAVVWEKVLRKVRTGQMPPPDAPQPDRKLALAIARWLETSLDDYAAQHPNPGRLTVHRLNRIQYNNAIRDLLGIDLDFSSQLPVDDSGYGFDNIGDVLSLSPTLLERYLTLARRISRWAVGDLRIKAGEDHIDAPREIRARNALGPRNERVSDDLPLGSRGGFAVKYYFPLDGEYIIRVKTNADPSSGDSVETYEVRTPVQAGVHVVGVSFPRAGAKLELTSPTGRPMGPQYGGAAVKRPPVAMDVRIDGARVKRFEVVQANTADVTKLIIGGPYNPTGRGDTPARRRIFICRPQSPAEEQPCAEKILTALARKAFRRPVTGADITPLMRFYQAGRQEADFDTGIQKALQALLVAPDFLFQIEQDPPGAAPGTIYPISNHELATRLSLFLWSSIPDDELLLLADAGKLRDPAVLETQVRRMIADPKSDALVTHFAGQWLQLRNLTTVRPDPDLFPEWDDSLRRAMARETEQFFATILRENRSVLDLLDADFTWLNQRLAEHYQIPRIYGSQFRRVQLEDPNRGGLLGQGSILTVTSYPNRTSVVQRGKWILENLLGAPPPPPPPNVPELKPKSADGRKLSMREALELHRANPTCASCHARMDPIGFALENYDATGKWRTVDAGEPINPTGKLPDGTEFSGPAGLKKLLLSAHRDEFVETLTEKLLTYALGRGVEYYDKPVVRAIIREAGQDGYRFQSLIVAIAKSTPFQMRRTLEK